MSSTRPSVASNIWKYYVYQFFVNLQLWFPIWVVYLTEQRGLSLAQVTLIDIPFLGSMIALQIPAAALADRWGRKPTLIAAGITLALAITLFGVASSFWLILASYLIWGIAFSLLYGTESAFIYDTLAELGRHDEYQRIYGIGFAVATVAILVGTLAGAPLAATTDLSVPILVSGAMAALGAIVALSFHEPSVKTDVHSSYGRIIRESLAALRSRKEIRFPILFYGLITIGSIGPMFFFQPFLVRHGVELSLLGVWQTPMRVAGVIGAAFAYTIVPWVGERRSLWLMAFALVTSYLLLGIWDSLYAQIGFLVMGFVVALSQPVITNELNRYVTSDLRATTVSMTNFARSLALIPTTPLLGLIASRSLSGAFLGGAAIVALAGIPMLFFWLLPLQRASQDARVDSP